MGKRGEETPGGRKEEGMKGPFVKMPPSNQPAGQGKLHCTTVIVPVKKKEESRQRAPQLNCCEVKWEEKEKVYFGKNVAGQVMKSHITKADHEHLSCLHETASQSQSIPDAD